VNPRTPATEQEGRDRQVGQVLTTLTVTNDRDRGSAESGTIPPDEVRTLTLADVLVDTGATHLCLPADVIARLGLPLLREVEMTTAVGRTVTRMFSHAWLNVKGREEIFSCVELPEGSRPLLGVLPLEALGLELDLDRQELRVIPDRGPGTHVHVYAAATSRSATAGPATAFGRLRP
jgi:predicted aspartyl protease